MTRTGRHGDIETISVSILIIQPQTIVCLGVFHFLVSRERARFPANELTYMSTGCVDKTVPGPGWSNRSDREMPPEVGIALRKIDNFINLLNFSSWAILRASRAPPLLHFLDRDWKHKMFPCLLILLPVWLVHRWYKELKRVPNVEDKYVYITGCDTGFGNLLARHLDKLHFNVIAGCYTDKGEDELKKATSERLVTVHVDVSDSHSVSKAAAHIKTVVGQKGLWAVVNNAGVAIPSAPTDWLTIEDYKKMLAVNLTGVIDVTLSVLSLIKEARGRVVNVSSVFGRISPFSGPYCVSKYGVESFSDGLRINMAPFGVRVACIEPGFFKTNVTDRLVVTNNLKMVWDKVPQNVKDAYGQKYFDDLIKNVDGRFQQLNDPDLMKVVGSMEHAIAAVHPRIRYSPGWDAKLFWLPMSYMPTWFTDAFFLKNIPKLKISER